MTAAREEIIGRVRAALADVPADDVTPVDWVYGRPSSTGDLGLVDRFAERVADYKAVVERVNSAHLSDHVNALLENVDGPIIADAVVRDLLSGVDSVWLSDDDLSPTELDAASAVITTVAVGIANTGTIVLDHGAGQGRRAVSLVPDVHLCLIRTDQIVSDVPEAVARLIEQGSAIRPQTWISGPSATSDIELDRVEGVHGPRTLHVIIVEA
ncbi:LutC/YkgG family protein [Gordonia sp. 852002-51296_SCH5728562-b]|uniref:LutC/YkgG family protein n=1 Tax=Gordonia sp. 852002-51296_SCH5728562-b TaxID=1834101 RepID=UPI0007EA5CD5|nr:lactate utilization protein C [Gordonia sp. 852002-51296_SCH5728562-b]OBA39483.1 lactate utilization protein C [Gordonia sp. 852002-51296_SCH5728562-b]